MKEGLALKVEPKTEEQEQRKILIAHLRSAIASLRDTDFGPQIDDFLKERLSQATAEVKGEKLVGEAFGEKSLPDSYVIEENAEVSLSDYNKTLQEVRNLIIEHKSDPDDFAKSLQELPDDPEELKQHVKEIYETSTRKWEEPENPVLAEMKRRRDFLRLISGMGIQGGLGIQRDEAIKSVLNFKSHFNFETNRFE